MSDHHNHHCCVIDIAGSGIMIEGRSGSGKTSLALGLLERAAVRRIEAFHVADDQAMLSTGDGGLIASTPQNLAGKVEIRGFGVSELPYRQCAVVNLVVRMVDDELIERMPEPKSCSILGLKIPVIDVPIQHEEAAARIVFAVLKSMQQNSK